MRCGFKYNLDQIHRQWDGLKVCASCLDRKPEDMSPPHLTPEGLPKHNASPDPVPEFRDPSDNGMDDL